EVVAVAADLPPETNGASGTNGANGEASEHAVAEASTAEEKPFLLAKPEPVSRNGERPGTIHYDRVHFNRHELEEGRDLVRSFDPVGCGSRDLRECLLSQLKYHLQIEEEKNGNEGELYPVLQDSTAIVHTQLRALQAKQFKEIARAIGKPIEAVMV